MSFRAPFGTRILSPIVIRSWLIASRFQSALYGLAGWSGGLPARVICHEKAENFGTLFLGAMIPGYMLIYHKYQKSCYCAPLLSVFKSSQTWKFLNSMCMSCKRFLFKQDFSNRCGMGFMNFVFKRERFLKPVYHELQEICESFVSKLKDF